MYIVQCTLFYKRRSARFVLIWGLGKKYKESLFSLFSKHPLLCGENKGEMKKKAFYYFWLDSPFMSLFSFKLSLDFKPTGW